MYPSLLTVYKYVCTSRSSYTVLGSSYRKHEEKLARAMKCCVGSFPTTTLFRISPQRYKESMSSDETTKPIHYPAEYIVPEVWSFKEQEGAMGGMNRPTAGSRKDQALPRGEHELQLYSLGTPNGIKVTILLEELHDWKGVEYDAWKISIFDLDQFGTDFVAVNPNSKIPAMLDTSFDPPLRVFESGSILKYIAEKHEAFIPTETRKKVECFNWLMWQMGSAPYIGGGFGHFYKYAPVKVRTWFGSPCSSKAFWF